MLEVLDELSSCISRISSAFKEKSADSSAKVHSKDENELSKILRLVTAFYFFNEEHGDSQEEAKEEEEILGADILECCDKCEYAMVDRVEDGKLAEVPEKEREDFAVSCLVKAYTLLRKFKESAMEEVIRSLDLALLLGLPSEGWNLPKAMDSLHEKFVADRHYGQDRRTLLNFDDEDDDIEPEDRLPQQMKLFCFENNHNLPDDIPSEECPSIEIFMKEFLEKNEPLKMIGCMEGWAAMVKWKYLSYLKRLAGARTVPIEMGDYSQNGGVRLITLSEYLDELSLKKPSAEIGYLAQHQLFDQEPKFLKDIIVPDYCALNDNEDITMNIWLGPAGTLTPIHKDPQPNILAQVVGRKLVTLFEPNDSQYLYPKTDRFTNTSQVDIRKPDLKQFPEFSKSAPMICTLEPGDMLFIPAGWWHAVESLDVSFSVNFFF